MTDIKNKKYYCYKKSDYVGFFRRWLIIAVDCLVILFLMLIPFIFHLIFLGVQYEILFSIYFIVVLIIYHIIFKYLKGGTLGYMLCGMKLVDFYGKKPSLYQVLLRFTYWFIFPIHILIDLIGLGASKNRSCMINNLSETFIVKQDAQPIEVKSIKSILFFYSGMTYIFRVIDSE